MYAGHVGIALGLRRPRAAPPLWLLVLAAQLPDWGDALVELYGSAPRDPGWLPHGFPLLGLGALAVAVVGRRITRRWRGGALAALACVSHWAADYLTGSKPTWPGGPAGVGLMWFQHPRRDFVVEACVTALGWALWRGSLPPAELAPAARARRRALEWGLLAVLVALQAAVDVVMARHSGGWR